MKKCFKCGVEKTLSEYYKHKGTRDGHLNKCKECTKTDTKLRIEKKSKEPEWVIMERSRSREKHHRLKYGAKYKPSREQKKATMDRYKERYPEKVAAKNNLKPNVKGNHLHHWSYNEQHYKDVIELSEKDHNTAHRFLIYDQERKMYRTTENILLDTKESHLYYITEKIKQCQTV